MVVVVVVDDVGLELHLCRLGRKIHISHNDGTEKKREKKNESSQHV